MRSRTMAALAVAASAVLLTACGGGGGGGDPVPAAPLQLGDPLPGLTQAELASFERGRVLFERHFKPSEGLGPHYNATSCASCHSTPTVGGSAKLYRNFYLARRGDPTLPSTTTGGQVDLPGMRSAVIPAYGPSMDQETATFTLQGGRIVLPHGGIDTDAVQVAQRNAPPIFGVGLFELVPLTTILQLADPNDSDLDGISGRYNTDAGVLGVLGFKAQSSGVDKFTRPPLFNQMGITSDPLPVPTAVNRQVSGNPNEPFTDNDGIPDPEISEQDLVDLVNFSRFLAPPQPRPFGEAEIRGEEQFTTLGCAKCHVPTLPSERGPVNAYTDLLLHDMGDDLADGMAQGTPQQSSLQDQTSHREFRTAPLWGVSFHAPFLHDGRAATLRDAIEQHAGEAASIRDAFLALPVQDQADVIAFLEAL